MNNPSYCKPSPDLAEIQVMIVDVGSVPGDTSTQLTTMRLRRVPEAAETRHAKRSSYMNKQMLQISYNAKACAMRVGHTAET